MTSNETWNVTWKNQVLTRVMLPILTWNESRFNPCYVTNLDMKENMSWIFNKKIGWLIHDFLFPLFLLLCLAWACICYISLHNKPSFPRKYFFLLPTKTSTARLCIKVCKKPVSSFSNFLSLILPTHSCFCSMVVRVVEFSRRGYKIGKIVV